MLKFVVTSNQVIALRISWLRPGNKRNRLLSLLWNPQTRSLTGIASIITLCSNEYILRFLSFWFVFVNKLPLSINPTPVLMVDHIITVIETILAIWLALGGPIYSQIALFFALNRNRSKTKQPITWCNHITLTWRWHVFKMRCNRSFTNRLLVQYIMVLRLLNCAIS